MAVYGRLDVYWPNGPIENYALEKPETAIGRLPGNDIVLDTGTLSRYHVKISHLGDQVSITDLESINGTYVDGVRLVGNEAHVLRGGEEIQIGDIRMIFQPVIVIANDPPTVQRSTGPLPQISLDSAAEQPTTVTTPIIEPLNFITALADPAITVTPGAHNQTHTDIQNTGDQTTLYTMRVDGAPAGWVRLERVEFELASGARTPISISFKPTRRSDSKPGTYPLTVIVAEKQDPTRQVSEPLLLTVRDFSGFGIALAASHARPDGSFDAYIHNQGNAPLPISLSGADPADAFLYNFQPATLTLAPGQRQVIHGQLQPKHAAWTGTSREQRFDVIARSNNAASFQASVSGKYAARNRLPAWVSPMLIPLLVGAALVIVALVGAFIVLPAIQPAATATATATATVTLTATDTPEPSATPSAVPVVIPTLSIVLTPTQTIPLDVPTQPPDVSSSPF